MSYYDIELKKPVERIEIVEQTLSVFKLHSDYGSEHIGNLGRILVIEQK